MESIRTLTDPPRPFSPHPATDHVVFILTPNEKRLFFAAEPKIRRPGVRASSLDAAGLSPRAWENALRDLRPSVLVTAWSCPPLPESWALAEDCPLRYVCSVTGSVKDRVPREMLVNGLLVSNWGVLVSPTVAEHALLMVLSLLRSAPSWPELLQRPRHAVEMMEVLRSRTLRGKRVGLHGFGAVARALVEMLRPFDVELAAYSHGVPRALMDEFGVRPCRDLAELFSHSEILIECEGLNDRTRGTVTESLLRRLPRDAVFVNVGRAAVVDETALVTLARERHLRIGLDVFHREPLPGDTPLRELPNVLLSPHVAGPVGETYPLCGAQALENLERYLNGEAPENQVTLEIYDRAT